MQELNMRELERQRAESIKNTGKYLEISLLIGEKDETPVAHIDLKKVGLLEMGIAILALRDVENTFLRKYPILKKVIEDLELEETIEINSNNSITKRGKEKQ